jgi:hypothetical protein
MFWETERFVCRPQWPCGLRRGSWPVDCWDRGFESRSRHGCLSASFCVVLSCVGRGLDGLITRPRSPTICLNSSRKLLYVRRPRSFKDCRATGGKSFVENIFTWGCKLAPMWRSDTTILLSIKLKDMRHCSRLLLQCWIVREILTINQAYVRINYNETTSHVDISLYNSMAVAFYSNLRNKLGVITEQTSLCIYDGEFMKPLQA